tara:strand:+ start:147 stop:431 length:285 start_codon:yes stop_codon:yes gene_type:complete
MERTMTRKVNCRKYKSELPGLDRPPFPGVQGEAIFNEVSKQAWEEWISHQTTLINEKRLNLIEKSARDYLADQREKFLDGHDFDRADGYVPENG